MIPLSKLERLPRHQRLRKILKIVTALEQSILPGENSWPPRIPLDLRYVVDVATILARDEGFDETTRKALSISANELLLATMNSEISSASEIRRPINIIRHILNAEVGVQIADWDLLDGSGNIAAIRRSFPGICVYLEDIRSPFNVGSMFRTAESFGVERIYLSPLCASPEHHRAARTAMGCVDLVPWERIELSALPGPLFALETGGTPLDDFEFPLEGIMLVGSEELGVSPQGLAAADSSGGRVSIATYGAKGSLNVGVAFGIAMRVWATRIDKIRKQQESVAD